MNKAGAVFPPGSHHPGEEILPTATGILIKNCTKFCGNTEIQRGTWRKFQEVTSDLVLKEGRWLPGRVKEESCSQQKEEGGPGMRKRYLECVQEHRL